MFRPAVSTFLFLAVFAGGAQGWAQKAKTLQIAAAADLQPVLPAIMKEFAQQTHLQVEASYASSATLATQILHGGPYGLFLAADMWARHDSPAQPLTLDSLRKPGLHTVAVANAEHAPYGRAAAAAIARLGLADTLKSKLVVAENIAQAAEYADSGNAEVGFLSLTSALTPRLSASGSFVEIPADTYPPLLQGAVVLRQPDEVEAARQFLAFLLSPKVRHELAERGLKAP